ncbi:MAG: heme-binding protein [Alphaproteobacteria bacterium]|nr:heme-binding protein [Alphaproteobacteria bacterium]NNF24292.1 heme-binding protein [Paracoccaceae bacterium]
MTRLCTAAILSVVLAAPAVAQDEEPLVIFKMLRPELALKMAQTALENCREAGFQVGVAVVDRFGVPQVFLRDRFAGPHTSETATRKAWTAVSFRASTLELGKVMNTESDSFGVRFISDALPLGGGMPVLDGDGSIVAGIGVSGAPSPAADEVCAEAGIEAIADEIAF